MLLSRDDFVLGFEAAERRVDGLEAQRVFAVVRKIGASESCVGKQRKSRGAPGGLLGWDQYGLNVSKETAVSEHWRWSKEGRAEGEWTAVSRDEHASTQLSQARGLSQ